ncbi:hypothetical protein C5167_014887 [Papaver somniferum]|uniref:MATH domain-containing protein n=1 Tax=Papaver somniferum TaxID=3469 RepID=A0A4Y7J8T5_PAPSO|nr:hypothetical protein C5167_014887 [Papaver somniferum]
MEKLSEFIKEKKMNLLDVISTSKPYKPMLCSTAIQSCIAPSPIRRIRQNPPTNYVFKIQSYSTISIYERCKSPSFGEKETGYTWQLCYYPKGKKEGGKGYFSIYLLITDTDKLGTDWDVKVDFRLFLFNHSKKNYLVQDNYETSFNVNNKEQGFARFINLKKFRKLHLFEDTFTIGAEIFVIKKTERTDSFSRIQEPRTLENSKTVTYKIDQFSKRSNVPRLERITVNKLEWKVIIYPKGNAQANKSVSMFIQLTNSSCLSPDNQVYVDYSFCIAGKKETFKRAQSWFSASQTTRGTPNFISLNRLEDPKFGYLVDDACTFGITVTVVGLKDTTKA